ncbi:MAG: hypothetical protein K1X64_08865 [Myxococcaceae bacterium]|nr:hypothetical protein [Myxococcaceae bacterium]
MTEEVLKKLGLEMEGTEAVLSLRPGEARNPLTKSDITAVRFMVMGDRLMIVEPPELVGAPLIHLGHIEDGDALTDLVLKNLSDHVFNVDRRSSELTMLGLHPVVDEKSLQLSAKLHSDDFTFLLATDRMGNFRVSQAMRGKMELTTSSARAFELSEFRERRALEAYLVAMFADVVSVAIGTPPPVVAVRGIPLRDIVKAFGDEAAIPPKSSLEILVELKVGERKYRFAAARLGGTTFRGLLAGAEGKLWAERFELADFPGPSELLARALKIPIGQVKVV